LTDPVIDFSDAPGSSATDAPTEPPRRRGRPRSPETIERDEQVLTALRAGPLTKAQLVEKLGLPPQRVYLSLWRLRREERVVRDSGGQTRHLWSVVA
jgi:predicted Rossmann fold nucleotide-binding protein DprA/Smf involved in DNA uptake